MTSPTAACVHFWKIDPPDADDTPDSKAVCKKCGDTNTFSNAINYSDWHGYNKTRPWTKDIAKATKKQKAVKNA